MIAFCKVVRECPGMDGSSILIGNIYEWRCQATTLAKLIEYFRQFLYYSFGRFPMPA